MRVESRWWEYFKRRFAEVAIVSLVWFGAGWLTYDFLKPFAMPKEERAVYKNLKELLNDPQTYKRYPLSEIRRYREALNRIEEKYALYKALPFLNRRAFIVAFISFSLPVILFILTSRIFIKRTYPFFFRIAQKEQPLKLGKPYRLLFFKDKGGILSLTEKEFVDLVFGGNFLNYARVMAFFNGEIVETDRIKFPAREINKRIEEFTEGMVRWGRATFKLTSPEDEKLFRACVYLSLLHHTASLYGNIPVSFLSPFIKNDTVNDFKSFYYYGKLPVKPSKARDFLTVFHTYPIDVLDTLKKEFTPLSFEKYDSLYFREEFFTNALSDYELEQKVREELEKAEQEGEKEELSRLKRLKQTVGKGRFFLFRLFRRG